MKSNLQHVFKFVSLILFSHLDFIALNLLKVFVFKHRNPENTELVKSL